MSTFETKQPCGCVVITDDSPVNINGADMRALVANIAGVRRCTTHQAEWNAGIQQFCDAFDRQIADKVFDADVLAMAKAVERLNIQPPCRINRAYDTDRDQGPPRRPEKVTMRERKVLKRMENYGPRQVLWIKSDWYCMACGKQDVWQAQPSGSDYYHDCEVSCHSCQHTMCCVGEVEDPKQKDGGTGVR